MIAFLKKVKKFLFGSAGNRHTYMTIGEHKIGHAYPYFVIAELGINHNGDISIAKKLIDAAAESGAQAVKFQKRTIPVVYSKEELAKSRAVDRGVLEKAVARRVLSAEAEERLKKSDFKDSTNGDLKWALEFTKNEYAELIRYAKEKGMILFASPWDEESVDFLESFGSDIPCYKIASASLTDHNLLRKIRATRKPVILSTGMSTLQEISTSIDVLGREHLALLHTVSTYPSEEKDLNLGLIPTFRHRFQGIVIGYSGHERGIVPTLAAAANGAHIIERHITLDKTMYGSDQSASLDPVEFTELVRGLRLIESAWGDGVKKVIDAEVPVKAKLRRV